MNGYTHSGSKPRRRRLSAEEMELWREATRTVARRPKRSLPGTLDRANPGEETRAGAALQPPETSPPQPPLVAAPGTNARPKMAPLERQLRQKLARGRAAPDAEIDLHGMRQKEAAAALRSFLTRAQNNGARVVLVVTGKGERPGSGELTTGVLRKSVPNWLRGAQYHAIVAGFEEAARPHGGSGALYVRLRRSSRAAARKPAP